MEKKRMAAFVIFFVLLVSLCLAPVIYKKVTTCAFPGCEYEKEEGSKYCELHALSVKFYGTPDYKKHWDEHPIVIPKNSSESSSSSSSTGSSTNKHYSSSSSNNSYDDGYDDVYDNDDYDWDR